VSVTLAFDLIVVMAALCFCIKFQPLFGSVDSTFEFPDLTLLKKNAKLGSGRNHKWYSHV
jgi:hypothetical protein